MKRAFFEELNEHQFHMYIETNRILAMRNVREAFPDDPIAPDGVTWMVSGKYLRIDCQGERWYMLYTPEKITAMEVLRERLEEKNKNA